MDWLNILDGRSEDVERPWSGVEAKGGSSFA